MMTNTLISLGLTRDSLAWFWSKLVTAALILISGTNVIPMDDYISAANQKWLTLVCVVILWLAGTYDSSPLPGKKE